MGGVPAERPARINNGATDRHHRSYRQNPEPRRAEGLAKPPEASLRQTHVRLRVRCAIAPPDRALRDPAEGGYLPWRHKRDSERSTVHEIALIFPKTLRERRTTPGRATPG